VLVFRYEGTNVKILSDASVFNMDLLHSRGFSIRGLPILPLHGINSDSARNYQLIDENPPEDWFLRRELPSHGREIHPSEGILPGITSSWKLIQTGKINMREKSSKR
jgi:hypothetical protein